MTMLNEKNNIEELKTVFSEFQNLIPTFNGKTIKQNAKIADEDILNLHSVACVFFEKGKLNESEQFFRYLCLLDSTNLDYILGLGAVLQRKKLYSDAVDIYALGHMLQTNDARPMFYAGQCHFFDRKYDKAKFCFDVVIEDNHSTELTQMATLFINSMTEGKNTDGR